MSSRVWIGFCCHYLQLSASGQQAHQVLSDLPGWPHTFQCENVTIGCDWMCPWLAAKMCKTWISKVPPRECLRWFGVIEKFGKRPGLHLTTPWVMYTRCQTFPTVMKLCIPKVPPSCRGVTSQDAWKNGSAEKLRRNLFQKLLVAKGYADCTQTKMQVPCQVQQIERIQWASWSGVTRWLSHSNELLSILFSSGWSTLIVQEQIGSRLALPRYCTSIYKAESRAQLGQECNIFITKHQKHCNFPATWGWPNSAEVEDKLCLAYGGILACTKIACAFSELAWNSASVFRFVPSLYASIAGAILQYLLQCYELRFFFSVAGAICQADTASFCDTNGCFAKTGSSLCFFLERFESTTPARFNLCKRSTLTDSWEGVLIWILLRYAMAMVWTYHA